MTMKVYLSGEIHTNWREQIMEGASGLDVTFASPVTDHDASDDCGVAILGAEEKKFWHDHKGAKVNAIRTRHGIETADIVVVRFGDKYKQWNAAFDAGMAAALGKALGQPGRRRIVSPRGAGCCGRAPPLGGRKSARHRRGRG